MDSQPLKQQTFFFDQYLLWTIIALIFMGLVMVTSASMAISERQFDQPFHFLFRQLIYLGLGCGLALLIMRISIETWQKMSGWLLVLSVFLLMVVLVPGIGREINGSRRWIGLGPIGMQISEFVKLAIIIYLASYLVRRHEEVQTRMVGFLKPMAVLGFIAGLLLLEPDFGATVVIMVTALTMMYLAGVRLWQFGILLLFVVAAMALLAVTSPYRMLRLTTFLHPWANQFNSGYQLTQSLIAFGRGGVFGVGLGGSVQKLFYLPEAHTDFLFAVLAEELGLIGILIMIALYVLLVGRILFIGRRAQCAGLHFSGFVSYGIAIWLGMQAIVNMGVSSGMLPTKGLTLPLLSYGGSSILMTFAALAIVMRIDYEARLKGPAAKLVRYRVR